jgi:hypothetical protein
MVSLTASSGPVAQKERVTLILSSTDGSSGEITIASATTNVKLKAGKQARLTLSAKQLNAGVPAGDYQLLVSVTDPDGSSTTIATGKSLVVRVPASRPSTR